MNAPPTTSDQSQALSLFTLMFGAPPGGWLGTLVQTQQEAGSLTALADLLAGTPQFQSRFAGKTTPAQMLDTYLSFIGLVPDTPAHAAAGAAVLAQLQAGASVGQITVQVLQFLQSTTEALFQPARQYLLNMVEVASYHTLILGLKGTSVDEMRKLLAGITSDPTSAVQAKQALDQLVAPPVVEPEPASPPPPPPPPAFTSIDPAGAIASQLGAYAGTQASANASGMSAQQLEALGAHAVKIKANGITSLGLDLGDVLMTDAISAALLGKAAGAAVVATGATAAEVDGLVAQVAHISNDGIAGTLPVTIAQLADVRGALASKLAVGLTLSVSGTAAADTINLTALVRAATATGGAGDDIYVVDSALHTIIEAGGGGTDTLQSAVTIALPANVEVLNLTGSGNIDGTGTTNSSILIGNSGNNHLQGADGNDRLHGGDGNDTLEGGTGSDTLLGDNGDDTLLGGDSIDILEGGAGADTLTGGSAGDFFKLGMISVGMAIDRVTDFGNGADRIQIYDPAGLGAGTLAAANFYQETGGSFAPNIYATGATPTFVYVAGVGADGGNLYFDADGTGAGVAYLIALIQSGGGPAAVTPSSLQLL